MTEKSNGVCCFSGHRQMVRRHVAELPRLLAQTLDALYRDGIREFRAGGAVGFDMLAELAVLEFRKTHPDVKLVLYLPCRGQDSKWGAADRITYEYTLSAADRIIYVSEKYFNGCMMKRNREMAQGCEVCVAYLLKSTGGTASTVDYAAGRGTKIINFGEELRKL